MSDKDVVDIVPKTARVRSLRFKVFTSAELKKFSVTKELFDSSSNNSAHAKTNGGCQDGLYLEHTTNRSTEGTVIDRRMGSDGSDSLRQECRTCGKFTDICGGSGGQFDCPGHFGHINLCSPQIWLLFSHELVRVLESVCPFCSKRIVRIPVRQDKRSRRDMAAAKAVEDQEEADQDEEEEEIISENEEEEIVSENEQEDDNEDECDEDDDNSINEEEEEEEVEGEEDDVSQTAEEEEEPVDDDILSVEDEDDSSRSSVCTVEDDVNDTTNDMAADDDDILSVGTDDMIDDDFLYDVSTSFTAAAAAAAAPTSPTVVPAVTPSNSKTVLATTSKLLSKDTTKRNKQSKVSSASAAIPRVDTYFTCQCFDTFCSVRFKYYCVTHKDDRSRYMVIKITARNSNNNGVGTKITRSEVSQKFIIPTPKIRDILEHITKSDWRAIFCAQHRDFPRKEPIPYEPVDLLVDVLPVVPPIARPAKKLENKRPADMLTRHYNQVITRNNTLSAIMKVKLSDKVNGAQPVEKKRRCKATASLHAGTATFDPYDDSDPTGQAILSHMGGLYNVDKHLTSFVSKLLTLEGVPVGRLSTKYNMEMFRGERALSTAVSVIVDKSTGKQLTTNLLQRLQGKGGRFRGNLAGKRVNYTARTVITPDDNIEVDQVSVPYSFARTLTIPEQVTTWNIETIKNMVRNGDVRKIVCILPSGAEQSTWCLPDDPLDKRERNATEKIKIGITVHRFLRDNDVVIMNRQPTLHKPSMQAHRITVRTPVQTNVKYSFGGVVSNSNCSSHQRREDGSRVSVHSDWFSTDKDNLTFGLNLSVTRPYNADFDGDEMNMHIPQTLEARAELMELMQVNKQLGCKFIGIVQDTLFGAYLMSSMDTFLTEEYATFVFMHAHGKYVFDPFFFGKVYEVLF